MQATITSTGQTFPIDALTEAGAYLLIQGHARFFPAALLTF